MADPVKLSNVDKDLFDRIWQIVKELDEREKHFNDMQNRYRALASTWLLAAFAGIGFVFTKTLPEGLAVEQVAIAIGAAGAAGIALLWVLDVLVYHDLLLAGYVVGERLEQLHPWLPPLRSNFEALTRGLPAVRWYLAAFYMTGISILCLLSAVIALLWKRDVWNYYFFAPAVLGLALDVVIATWTKRALGRKDKLPQWPSTSPAQGA